jgi:hypothetical protein
MLVEHLTLPEEFQLTILLAGIALVGGILYLGHLTDKSMHFLPQIQCCTLEGISL